MSDEDPVIDGRVLSTLKVTELRDALASRGLNTKGLKADLVERLREFVTSGDGTENSSPVTETNSPKVSSPTAENPIIAQYRARQQEKLEEAKREARRARESESSSFEDEVQSPKNDPKEDKKEESVEKAVEKPTPKVAKVPSPPKEPSPQPIKSQTPEPAKEPITEPKATTQESVKESSPEPEKVSHSTSEKLSTPEPVKAPTPEPVKAPSPEPIKVPTPEPIKEPTPEPIKPSTRQPIKAPTPEPTKEVTNGSNSTATSKNKPKDEPVKEHTSEPTKQSSNNSSVEISAKTQSEKSPTKPNSKKATAQVSRSSDVDEPVASASRTKSPESKMTATTELRVTPKLSIDDAGDDLELDYGEDEDRDVKDEMLEPEPTVKEQKPTKAVENVDEDAEELQNKPRQLSPSRFPVSEILHIRGLTRPFVINQLRNLISTSGGGKLLDFWIDSIRSHCFAVMESKEVASTARTALHGITWPDSNPKTLSVQFDTSENFERHRSGTATNAASGSGTSSARVERTLSSSSNTSTKSERLILDRTNGITRGGLRVTVEAALRDNKKLTEERERRNEKERERREEAEKVDREKEVKNEKGDDRRITRKREHSETPPFSRSVEERKRERVEERRRDGDEKRTRRDSEYSGRHSRLEDVNPPKTADELFMKTKTLPAIYYMPATEEEKAARQIQREGDQQRTKDREKREERSRR